MKKAVLALALLSLVAACASPFVAKPFDREAANVTAIAVVKDTLPEGAGITQVASAASNFGLIGALVDAGIQASDQARLTAVLTTQKFDGEAAFLKALEAKVNERGFTGSVVDVARNPRKRDFVDSFPGQPTADAYLDVVSEGYGYISSGFGAPYRPAVSVKVRLISSASKQVLMDNLIEYNPLYPTEGAITLSPNPAYSFMNLDEIEQQPEKVAEGLTVALDETAAAIAKLLD
jgi:hypothetical protein